MRRRPGRRPRSRASRLLAASLGGFLVACSAVLIFAGELPGGASEAATREAAPARVLRALESAQRAQRALEHENYGEVSEHLAKTQDALASALAELDGVHPDSD